MSEHNGHCPYCLKPRKVYLRADAVWCAYCHNQLRSPEELKPIAGRIFE